MGARVKTYWILSVLGSKNYDREGDEQGEMAQGLVRREEDGKRRDFFWMYDTEGGKKGGVDG